MKQFIQQDGKNGALQHRELKLPLEIERKWLVEKPDMSGFQWTPKLITQAYLSLSGAETVHRVRKVISKDETKFYYTVKTHRRAGVNVEQEKEITEDIYEWMLKKLI